MVKIIMDALFLGKGRRTERKNISSKLRESNLVSDDFDECAVSAIMRW